MLSEVKCLRSLLIRYSLTSALKRRDHANFDPGKIRGNISIVATSRKHPSIARILQTPQQSQDRHGTSGYKMRGPKWRTAFYKDIESDELVIRWTSVPRTSMEPRSVYESLIQRFGNENWSPLSVKKKDACPSLTDQLWTSIKPPIGAAVLESVPSFDPRTIKISRLTCSLIAASQQETTLHALFTEAKGTFFLASSSQNRA